MLKVNPKNYTNLGYNDYLKQGNVIDKPENTTYVVGQVVYIKEENALGVVLGCIDEHFGGDLRTDMSGMVSIDGIRFATMEDFDIDGIRFVPRLKDECANIEARLIEDYEIKLEEHRVAEHKMNDHFEKIVNEMLTKVKTKEDCVLIKERLRVMSVCASKVLLFRKIILTENNLL